VLQAPNCNASGAFGWLRSGEIMAITSAQFEALSPAAYSDARGTLLTGDIVLFHSQSLPLELAEHFTDSLWGHAACVLNMGDIDRVLLLESVQRFGVRAVAMSNRVNGSPVAPGPYPGRIVALRHSQFPPPTEQATIAKMGRFALERLGYPYSPAEIARISLRVAAGLAGKTLSGPLDPTHAYVCSEYVAKCYEAVGIDLAADKEGFIAPADIANDPNVYPVCAIRPDELAAVGPTTAHS
jgi:hypothetical protein